MIKDLMVIINIYRDKLLLIVPVEKNKKMPLLMRPYVDLYFIYATGAVEVKEKKK